MKRTSYFVGTLVLLLALVLTVFVPVNARAAPASESALLSLKDLGAEDIILQGPYDTARVRFSLPANWALMDGAQIQIMASAFFASPGADPNAASGYFGAMLDVYFNNQLQQSIPLVAGSNLIYQVPIHPADLESVRPDGGLDISFFLNAAIDCEYEFHKTTVLISSATQLSLPYALVPLKTDLRRLPWPIYQPGLKEPDAAIVLIPQTPTADEMQAALLIMAGFGRMTNQKMPISLLRADEFSETVASENNLIVVGKPGAFSMLSSVSLPIPIAGARFTAAGMQEDDGVIELVASPWNPGKTVLLVSGNTDAGVVKAAQAFTTQNLQTGDTPNAVVIAKVNPITQTGVLTADSEQLTSTDFTLSDLGYPLSTQNVLGTNWFTYHFTIPPGQVPIGNPYFDLVFSNSVLVDAERSGIVIYLNGQLVGSSSFTKENANYVTTRINLPSTGLIPGANQIDVAATLIPRDICSVFTATGLWMTVFSESLFHIPLAPSVELAYKLSDIRAYPSPFTNVPNLDRTTFVMSGSDAVSWRVAGDLAYHLGGEANGSVLSLEVAFAGAIKDLPAGGQNLIIIGKPANLPLIAELGDALPARFDPGSNVAILENQQITYRFSGAKSLGYLELFAAPWDATSTILAVLGTTDEGLGYAGSGLLDSKIRSTLKGNFVSLDGDRASVVDTRSGLGIGRPSSDLGPGLVVQETPVPATPSVFPPSTESGVRQQILYGIYVVLGLMVVVILLDILLRKRLPPARS